MFKKIETKWNCYWTIVREWGLLWEVRYLKSQVQLLPKEIVSKKLLSLKYMETWRGVDHPHKQWGIQLVGEVWVLVVAGKSYVR